MEIGLYYNLTDFKEFYLKDFEDNWEGIDYIDYLNELKIEYDNLAKLAEDNNEFIANYFNFDDMAKGIEPNKNLINAYVEQEKIDTNLDFKTQFFKILELNSYAMYGFLCMNFESISGFIKREIIKFKVSNPKTPETPELDFSNNSDKVKLIMLEKLGVIDYIKTIQTKPETISHTSEILSTITGIPTKTLNTYLYPMIRPHRDDDDKNSPYKNPENREKAERELIKLKIKNIDANR